MTRFGSLRYLWVAPWTAVGVAAAVLAWATGGSVAWRHGVLEIWGGIFQWLLPRIGPHAGIAAITIGHSVVAADGSGLHRTRAHERVHVGQFEQWGPFFPLVYCGASLAAWLGGGDYYLDNRFEREARRVAP